MKIAIPHQNGNVFANFGRTGQFIIYETDGKNVISSKIVFTHGQNAKGLASLLAEEEVELVLCKSCGKNAMAALDDECIEVIEGCDGATDEVVAEYM